MTTPPGSLGDTPTPPVDAPHDGWTLLPSRASLGLVQSFVTSSPQSLQVAHFMREADRALVGRAWFGPLAEGPPRHAHGGAIAAVLDDVMGSAAWLAGHRVVAAKIEIEFKRPVPLGATTTFAAFVTRAEGKRVHVRGELSLPDGALAAAGVGLFIVIDIQKLRDSVT